MKTAQELVQQLEREFGPYMENCVRSFLQVEPKVKLEKIEVTPEMERDIFEFCRDSFRILQEQKKGKDEMKTYTREELQEMALDGRLSGLAESMGFDLDDYANARELIDGILLMEGVGKKGIAALLDKLGVDEPIDGILFVWEAVQELRSRRFVTESELEKKLKLVLDRLDAVEDLLQEVAEMAQRRLDLAETMATEASDAKQKLAARVVVEKPADEVFEVVAKDLEKKRSRMF